ncbi:GNAT family N-acetyltransferase [Antribacter gilvus]|uniref:GNAT family N-acetyltransferase n=1 Tax=Antribacter gilvus TaxID=2304675 RepID=UPI000F7AB482|nr:GNAT family N-acetyltransferase [Antribacter gilvus]
MIDVRRYQPSDAERTLDVFRAAVRRTALPYYSEEAVLAWAPDDLDLEIWARRRRAAHTFCAHDDALVVGFSDIRADGVLDMLFVHPDHGGIGVARRLVTTVIAEAEAMGLTRIETHASRAARPAFERFGFVVDRLNDSNWVGGQNVPNYDMHLDLLPTPSG